MNISRLDFLRGGLSAFGFAALGSGRLFAAPRGWKHGGKPNLVFGVVSDTHIRTDWTGKKPSWRFPLKYFKAALEHFKAANVDAVVHCGDFAHRGMMMSVQFHADTWREVFGGNGGPVRLFVTGNHDIIGGNYGNFAAQLFPDEEERRKWTFAGDVAGNWERIWGEPYEEVWHKEVKGYHFIGRHWDVDEMKTAEFIERNASTLGLASGARPFFYLQHVGSGGKLNKALAKWPNAVGFFGHAHASAANWNVIRDDCGAISIQVPSCEPRGTGILSGDGYIAKAKLEGKESVGSPRQGYVVRVYDDMLVIERLEFGEGGSLGADWVMPLGKYDPHPFSKEELKKAIGEPQFRDGAKLVVGECCHCENVANANSQSQLENGNIGIGNISTVATLKRSIPPVKRLRVKIPLADGNPASRVYAYEAVVVGSGALGATRPTNQAAANGAGGSQFTATETDATKRVPPKLFKAVYAAGCNMGIGREPNKGVTTLEIPEAELPPGDSLTVAVRPLSSLGTSGKPISAIWRRKG